MSAAEITTSYRTAKNQQMQIGILADLNLCSKEEMREVLVQLGVLEPAKKSPRAGRKPLKLDEEKARALWDSGANDQEIAEAVGVSKSCIQRWREREELVRPRGKRKQTKKEGEKMTEQDRPAESAATYKAANIQPAAKPEKKTLPYVTVGELLGLLRQAAEKGGCEDAPLEVQGCRFREMHLRVTYNIGIREELTVTLEGEPLRDEKEDQYGNEQQRHGGVSASHCSTSGSAVQAADGSELRQRI